MASWGDVAAYDEMIGELGTFCQQIGEACAILQSAANTCVDALQGDKASLAAAREVVVSAKKYEEAIELATKLAQALAQERDDLVEYLKTIEELGGE